MATNELIPPTFAEALATPAGLRCPECGKPLICMHGVGWDYDTIYCGHCAFEYQYDTTTMVDEE